MDKSEDIKLDSRTIENLKELLVDGLVESMMNPMPPQYQQIHKNVDPQKLTKTPHEIIFDITAHVMEENEKGEVVATKEICNKKFHIPVPVDKEYNLYMKTFFDHIEQCLIKSIKST